MQFERFAGTHYDIGLRRGKVFRDDLLRCRRPFDSWTAETREFVDHHVSRFRAALERVAPELAEEMRGVAEGAALPVDEVHRLNFVEELKVPTGCSQIGFTAGENGPIMAKAEDAGFGRTYVVTEVRPDRSYAQLHVGAVNWVVSSGSGVNEAGLCVGQSSVWAVDRADGIPRLTMLRLVLERCATVAEAAEFLGCNDLALSGMNFLMADATGDLAVVERSPSRCAVRRPEADAICSTNHYVDPGMRAVLGSPIGSEPDLENLLAREVNSRQRYGRLCDFIDGGLERPVSRPALEGLMRSHGPGGICQHGILSTTWSAVFVPRPREVWLSDGPPCRSTFQAHKLENRRQSLDVDAR